ncbi:MAG: phage tail protein [Hyphomicrobiaceae bacterium]|nr:phage tail protein [Hyphomicrobiaceae bacterium]
MATISFKWTGDGVARMNTALEAIEGPRRRKAFRRALNHTGNKTFTQVKRAVSKQMNVKQRLVVQRLKKWPAHGGGMSFAITSSGKAFTLKDVNGTKVSKKRGVTASPWGNRKTFSHAFAIKRWDGNIFQRKGKSRFPIFKLLGPNINKQLVKDESAAAFQRVVATELPLRLEHEIKVITNGVLS